MSTNNPIWCDCEVCKQSTRHDVLFSHSTHSEDPEYWWKQDYLIVRCCGCGSVAHCNAVSEEGNIEMDDDGNEYIPTVYNVIPPAINPVDAIETFDLPFEIRKIYVETIDCINRGNLILAAAGCRATIEAICREQNVSGKQLEAMINNLAQKRIITKNDRDHLHAIRFMGNDSIHDTKAFDLKEIKIVAKIINTILTSLYIIHEDFQKLKIKPVTSYAEFIKVLDEKLDGVNTGHIGNLQELTKGDRRIIKEDLVDFEKDLIDAINAGTYTKLTLSPPAKPSGKQRYMVK